MIDVWLLKNLARVFAGWRVSGEDLVEFAEGNSSANGKANSFEKWIDENGDTDSLIDFGEEDGSEDHTSPTQYVDDGNKEFEFVDAFKILIHNTRF